jgi:excinuclease UvrABC nuclease subunit
MPPRKERNMPFSGNAFRFDDSTLNTINEVAGVYGLFQQTSPNYFVCRYVGTSDNLRRRLREHFNNPPISGCTHFFAEVISNAVQRAAREQALIREFDPPGNVQHTR